MSDQGAGARVDLAREQGFRFRVRFGADGVPALQTDEPPPLGGGAGPNPSALLAAAVGNCLASSLLFCMQKARLEVQGFEAEVWTTTVRNDAGRIRIGEIQVRLAPSVTPEVREKMGRCLEVFESFCMVTESVRHGIAVKVAVEPREAKVAVGAGEAKVAIPPREVKVAIGPRVDVGAVTRLQPLARPPCAYTHGA